MRNFTNYSLMVKIAAVLAEIEKGRSNQLSLQSYGPVKLASGNQTLLQSKTLTGNHSNQCTHIHFHLKK